MAAEDGLPSDHLSFLKQVAEREHASRYSIFMLLRQAEARAPGLPKIGHALSPRQNVADMAHEPTLDFPGPTVESIAKTVQGRWRVSTLFLGLTGPMGPLPLHLTEFARYEKLYVKTRPSGDGSIRKRPFGRFLDLLTDRMLQFFYRAWADTQPAVQSDRPDQDRFAGYIAAIAGIKQDNRSAFPYSARIAHAGLFTSRRSPAVIIDGLSDLLHTRVTLREFVPRWRDIAPADRTRIGTTGSYQQLGQGAVLGRRVRTIDDTFEIVLRCSSLEDHAHYLPKGRRFPVVRDFLGTLAPPHLDWNLRLELNETKAAGARLDGRSPLGWASWLAPAAADRYRLDTKLIRQSRAASPREGVV